MERRRHDRLDLDVRGLIGLMAVTGLFGIVFVQLATATAVAIPPEVAGVVGSVVGFYFGSKGAGTEQQVQQGLRIEEIHALVNSRMDKMVSDLAASNETVADQRRTIDSAAAHEGAGHEGGTP